MGKFSRSSSAIFFLSGGLLKPRLAALGRAAKSLLPSGDQPAARCVSFSAVALRFGLLRCVFAALRFLAFTIRVSTTLHFSLQRTRFLVRLACWMGEALGVDLFLKIQITFRP